jgi:gluconokinase
MEDRHSQQDSSLLFGPIIILMGVSGSGKSTIGYRLATKLGCQFQEGDEFHSKENVDKMSKGMPLTDSDRLPWLRRIAAQIDEWRSAGRGGVISCSALKRSYREIILSKRTEVMLVYLKGSYDLIRRRMLARKDHYMPVRLLDSQFAALEEPTPDEHPVIIGVDQSPAESVAQIIFEIRGKRTGTALDDNSVNS